MKINITYRDHNTGNDTTDTYEAELINTQVADGFFTVFLHDDKLDDVYGTYQKSRKAMYPQFSVMKVVTE